MLEKLKSILHEDAYFYAVLLVLVAVTSFGLGRNSIKTVPGISMQTEMNISDMRPLTPAESSENDLSTNQKVVASKSGNKYHLLTCPGAKQIKEENLIEFTSPITAKAAGYAPAANCQDYNRAALEFMNLVKKNYYKSTKLSVIVR